MQGELEALAAQQTLLDTRDHDYTELTVLLTTMPAEVRAIDASNAREKQRQLMELLVHEVRVNAPGTGRTKEVTLGIESHFLRQDVPFSRFPRARTT